MVCRKATFTFTFYEKHYMICHGETKFNNSARLHHGQGEYVNQKAEVTWILH